MVHHLIEDQPTLITAESPTLIIIQLAAMLARESAERK